MSSNEQVRNEIILDSFKIKFANEKKIKFTEVYIEKFLKYGPQIVIEFKKKRIFKMNQNLRDLLDYI